MPYQPGDILLDKYRIEALIGEGAFAQVYSATHLSLQVPRALKVLHKTTPGIGSTEYSDFQARFQLEAQLGARLDHPNIVRVYDFEQDEDTLILVMAYAPGGTLSERIQEARNKSRLILTDEVLQIAIDTAKGLAAIHDEDAVHRDLKPSNILFDAEGNAEVADLGLAQIPGGPSMRSQLSQPAPHPGTPGYMSPEQASLTAYLTPASDVYALGLILFEMLTLRVYSNQPPGTRLRDLREDIPVWLDNLVADMLAGEPDQRPWNGAQVTERLRQGKKVAERPAIPWRLIVPVLLVLVILAVAVPVVKNLLPSEAAEIDSTPIVAIAEALPWDTMAPSETATSSSPPPTGEQLEIAAVTPVPVEQELTDTPTPTQRQTATATPEPSPTEEIPHVTDEHGIPMVLVSASPFEMGSIGSVGMAECRLLYQGECIPGDYTDEEPSHIVTLDAFYIDQYETTNAQYEACVNAGICDPPSQRDSHTRNSYYGDPRYQDYPVIYVKWSDADTYCQWRGTRLPSEAEWEKAARGTEALTYPWGNRFDGEITNFCDRNCGLDWRNMDYDDGYADSSPTGAYPGGASPYGVLDMVGNVWEWVADRYASNYYASSPAENPNGPAQGTERVIRGGAWNCNGSILRTTARTGENPNDGYYNIGFRCARSP